MLKFFKRFVDYNQREIDRLQKIVDEISAKEEWARKLSAKDFPKETQKLKEQVRSGKKQLNEVLVGAFALVREAARRVLGQRHVDVQLMAGIALSEGKKEKKKTGEGKTLSATTALYLHALKGRGAHLVTVNDYLARRDAGWMGGVFHYLGMRTAAMISDQSYLYDPEFKDKETSDWRLGNLKPISRQEAYQADITYGINSEFGFDYLRDNMASSITDLRQRDYYFAVIDEADSILIDEARTPHIISSPYEKDTSRYYDYAKIVKTLDPKNDFVVDEKERTANLTEGGISKIEKALGVTNIYEKDFDTLFHIEAALKAETLFKSDKDYIVRGGNEVVIVDEFTGRLLEGRRFSEGIHQAIEAKENVAIQRESKTLATISLQNYFRMYEVLAGMTGTAATEAEEFNKIYKIDVVIVPTHRDMIRKDHPDMIYKTEKGKFDAVVEEIAKNYKIGRPALVGTTSIEKNEYLSSLLNKRGVPHEVLNAKNHEREAHIIAKAGERGAVTVATNMAGRGVDIVLGGESPSEFELGDEKGKSKEKFEKKQKEWQKKHDEVVGLGGLIVIGTERHESRRIDNQLRGRSGRQGDPGDSLFFVALEDDLMRIFGGEQISRLMTFFNLPEDQPLTHSMVSKAIEQAQIKVEGVNFDRRKHVVEYDDVLNKQREIIYTLRRKILLLLNKDLKEFKETVFEVFQDELARQINQYLTLDYSDPKESIDKFIREISLILKVDEAKLKKLAQNKDIEGATNYLIEELEKEYERREKKVGKDIWNTITQNIFLTTIDQFWMEHLTSIEDLREGIGLRGYAGTEPIVAYKNEAFSIFEKLIGDINAEAAQRVFRVDIDSIQVVHQHREEEPMEFKPASAVNPLEVSPANEDLTTLQSLPEEVPIEQQINEANTGFKITPPGVSKRKIGRNDPCWCGSGKKYKKCHYPN